MESTFVGFETLHWLEDQDDYLSLSLGDIDVVIDVIGSSALGAETALADTIT